MKYKVTEGPLVIGQIEETDGTYHISYFGTALGTASTFAEAEGKIRNQHRITIEKGATKG